MAFGGGRKHFLFKNIADPGNNTLFGKREDGRDLTREWQNKSGGFKFIWNKKQFEDLDSNKVEHVLGNSFQTLFLYMKNVYKDNAEADLALLQYPRWSAF